MKFLAIDTSQEYLTVIAQNESKVEIIHLDDCAFQHSVTMLSQVEIALDKVGLSPKDIDFCAVVIGAGSFTGIRIGIATAKGLCAPFNKKALAITSFDTIAYAKEDGNYLAVIDARHDNFYVCGYTDGEISYPARFIGKSELLELKDYKFLASKEIDGLGVELVDTSKGLYNAVNRNFDKLIDAENLAPLYLRLSQAEEGRK